MNPSSADDLRITRTEPIESPATLLAELLLSPAARAGVVAARASVGEILSGRDQRLLCVVGPCSIHDVAAAREYASRLKRLADELSGQLLVVMRVYFAKPRTTVGWKGLINDPDLNGSFDIGTGLRLARQFGHGRIVHVGNQEDGIPNQITEGLIQSAVTSINIRHFIMDILF